MIGHNGYSFDDVVAENLERGLYWAQRDALIRIIRDPEMGNRHEIVLAEIVAMTNAETGTCYPGRKWLADATGYTEGTVATTIKELVASNYLVSTRRAPEGSTRALAHYAVVKPSVEELRAAVDAHIAFIRASNSKSKEPSARWADVKTVVHSRRADVNPVVHLSRPDVNTVVHVNEPDVNPVVHVNTSENDLCSKADVNPVVPTVTSLDINLELTPVSNLESCAPKRAETDKVARAHRLPSNWFLGQALAAEVLAKFRITESKLREEADGFRDFWHSAGGAERSEARLVARVQKLDPEKLPDYRLR